MYTRYFAKKKMPVFFITKKNEKKNTAPNLTSNFETHNNVGDNFYFVYKYIYIYKF